MSAVIRRIGPDEGRVLEAIRLAALAESPASFASTLAAEADQPAAHWDERAALGAAGERSVTFLAVIDTSVVGMVAAYRPDPAELTVELVSMWVSPEQRRAGIASDLVDAVVVWARQSGATAVELWVTRGNDAAVRLYEAEGFRSTGNHQPLPSDPCKDEVRMRRSVGSRVPGVTVRPMTIEDVALLVRWDDDPDVAAAIGGPGADWYDWPTELARDVPWRELLIAQEDGRPIGFVQLTDAAAEESHYWGDVEPGTWALDIWIGSPEDRGRGLGTAVMELAVGRVFDRHRAETLVIDPAVDNPRAIAFYEQLGFERVGIRTFGDDESLVMRLVRTSTP